MTFSDVLKKKPESASVFFKYGMHCVGCAFAGGESIEQGAKAHGLSDRELKKLIEELNSI